MLEKLVDTFLCACLFFVSVFTSYALLNDCSQKEPSESVKSIMTSGQTVWYQKEFELPAKKRGCHLVTEDVERNLPELKQIKIGLAHIHIKHTSASLALNENWDPDVRKDTEMMLNKIVPEGQNYLHSCEGSDDMMSQQVNVRDTLTSTLERLPGC